MNQRYGYALASLSLLLLVGRVDAFTTAPLPTIHHHRNAAITTTTTTTSLQMAAKKTAGSKKSKSKSTTKAGGGFGGSTSSTSASSTSSNSNNQNAPQVRSVNGHTGSGTKPLRAAANTYDSLRKIYGVEGSRDVYVRAPLNDATTFWFVGKIAFRDALASDPSVVITPNMAIWSQKRLILEYAKLQLRPQNLGGAFAKDQEIWLAAGDSEMDVVQNKSVLTKVVGSISKLPAGFVVKDAVGFAPEIYVGDEVQKGGLRVQRDPLTGEPLKPVFEVNQSV